MCNKCGRFSLIALLLAALSNVGYCDVPQQSCEILQITNSTLDSRYPSACDNGNGMLFSSRADLAGNGHADQEDLFFADLSDPSNPLFYQLTNSDRSERGLSISQDCSGAVFNSRSDYLSSNPSNYSQLFYVDISDPSAPLFRQLTNTAANNRSAHGSISDDGSKIAIATQEDLTGNNLNPDASREFFIFDFDNGVDPFGQLTSDPTIGSISSNPIINPDGSRVAFVNSKNFIPPGNNANGGRELYLAEIAFDPPNPPSSTLFQVTDLPDNSLYVGGIAFARDGEQVLLGSVADLVGDNGDGNQDLFLADVSAPSAPLFTQITRSAEFTASRGVISEDGTRIAFVTDNPDFHPDNGDVSDELILSDINYPANPLFRPLTDLPAGSELDDINAADDFSMILFVSEADLVSGGNADGNDEIFLIQPDGCFATPAEITPGLWSDRSRQGHGGDLQRSGGQYFWTFFSYGDDQTGEWYLSLDNDGDISNGFSGDAMRYSWSATEATTSIDVGSFDIQFGLLPSDAPCDDGVDRGDASSLAALHIEIDGQQVAWCIEPQNQLLAAPTGTDFTGHWYGGSADAGWGATIQFTEGDGGEDIVVVTLYYYDTDNNPRWAQGVAVVNESGDTVVNMAEFTGYCRDCAPTTPTETGNGAITLHFTEPSTDLNAGNTISISVSYLATPGGDWIRDSVPIQLISDPIM